MELLSNPADATFEKLREIGYNEEILRAVENENFLSLKGNEILRNKEMAEYLLYACVNSKDARYYPVYVELQEDVKIQLLTETKISNSILQTAPEVIKNTPLASDRNAILNNIEGKPEIAKYISDDLVRNSEFMNEMISKEPETVKEMAEKHSVENLIAQNPSLVNNPQFMAEAILQDVNAIKYMNKEMLNNYDVFREASKNNKDIILYAIKNSEELGLDAITAVNDTARENVKEAAQEAIEEDIKNNENSKLKDWDKDRKRYEEMNGKEPNAFREAAMISQVDKIADKQGFEKTREQLNSARLAIIKVERAMQEEHGYEIQLSDIMAIHRIKCLERRLEEEIEKDSELKQVIEECKEAYKQILEKYREQRKEAVKIIRKNMERLSETEERSKEQEGSKTPILFNNEVHLIEMGIVPNGKVEGKIVVERVLEPVPEFVNKGIEKHGFPSQTIEINVPEVHNTRDLNARNKSVEMTGPGE